MEDVTLIKKIEAYLQQEMTAEECDAFEKAMKQDPGLTKLVESYRHTFEALKHNWLRSEVVASGKSYYAKSLIKSLTLGAIAVVTVGILVYSLLPSKATMVAPREVKTRDTLVQQNQVTADTGKTEFTAIKQGEGTVQGSTTPSVTQQHNAAPSPQPEVIEMHVSTGQLPQYISSDTEVFTISNLRDTILSCKDGTLVTIKAHTLFNARTNEFVTGAVKIHVNSFNDYRSLFKARISTQCGERLLQSGGSCFISAKHEEDSVILKPGSALRISFAGTSVDTAMRTFYGERNSQGIVTWKGPSEYSEGKKQNITDTFYYVKTYKTKSSATGRYIYTHVYSTWDRKKTHIFETDINNHKKWGETYYMYDDASIEYGSNKKTISSAYRNIVLAARFGYINCDHFVNEPSTYDISIQSTDTLLESFLFIKNFRSCMYSDHFSGPAFHTVPSGKDLLIITVLRRNNMYYMNVTHSTNQPQITITELIPYNKDIILEELDKINPK